MINRFRTFVCERFATILALLNATMALAFAITTVGLGASAHAQETPETLLLKARYRNPSSATESLPAPTGISFHSDAWVFSEGATHRVETFQGKESLFRDGRAYLEDIAFCDGIIEVDIAPDTTRSFAALIFRLNRAAGEGEL